MRDGERERGRERLRIKRELENRCFELNCVLGYAVYLIMLRTNTTTSSDVSVPEGEEFSTLSSLNIQHGKEFGLLLACSDVSDQENR